MNGTKDLLLVGVLALVMLATAVLALTLVSVAEAPSETATIVQTSGSQTSTTTESTITQAQISGQIYQVQTDDQLQGIAEAFYNNTTLHPAIVWASTIRAIDDTDFVINTENNTLNEGQSLLIPDQADVETWEQQFLQLDTAHADIMEMTIQELQDALNAGTLTSASLIQAYFDRIQVLDRSGPLLNSVIETNPEALSIARSLDRERAESGPRGPLHGIPILLKDNIDTDDQMQTTAGSMALLGSKPAQDAFVVAQLRQAGAIILGKANLSEWANFRGSPSISGWSARGGLTRNPYRLDHTPWGSSSGSAVAVAANLVTVALGTETAGSISAPASINGVVGLKPTVGLTSRAGVVPIAHSYDTVGPLARTVTDAALVLSAIAGVDSRDSGTAMAEGNLFDYQEFLDADGLEGARIGVPINLLNYNEDAHIEALFEQALDVMRNQGAEIVEVEMPGLDELFEYFESPNNFGNVLRYEFKSDIAQYLSTRVADSNGSVPTTLDDLVELNEQLADQELSWFGQELFEESLDRGGLDEAGYLEGVSKGRRIAGQDGIDTLLQEHNLDVLVLPALESFARIYAALPGYPLLTVPAAFTDGGLPFSIGFFSSAFEEPTLIKMAYAFEQATQARRPPQYLLHVANPYAP